MTKPLVTYKSIYGIRKAVFKYMNINDVVVSPIISEKSTKDATLNKFTFRVAMKTHKGLIRAAIEDKFKVNVLRVSTNIVKGKKVRVGLRRIEIEKSPWKKATVTLKAGQKIAIFDTGGGK